MNFFKCNICGNLVELVLEGKGELVCCGEPMEKLISKQTEEGNEKHLPVVSLKEKEINIKIGSIEHPMTETHYIQWIYIFYNNKCQRVKLNPNDKPETKFIINENFDILEVFEYCNVHGLWKTIYKK